MKWLLYVLAGVVMLVAAAVVTLLLLSRDESRLAASVEVARPPQVVFAWISEPQRLQQWVGWLVEIRPITPQQSTVGAREIWVMEDRNNNNQRMEIESQIVEYRPPVKINARLTATEGFTGEIDYALEAVGEDRTRLQYVATYRYDHWLAKLLEPLIRRSAQQKLEEDLARLKGRIEASDVAGGS